MSTHHTLGPLNGPAPLPTSAKVEQPPCSLCKRPMKSLQEFVSHSCPGYLFTSREVDERVAATRKATLEEVRDNFDLCLDCNEGNRLAAWDDFQLYLNDQLAGGDE